MYKLTLGPDGNYRKTELTTRSNGSLRTGTVTILEGEELEYVSAAGTVTYLDVDGAIHVCSAPSDFDSNEAGWQSIVNPQ